MANILIVDDSETVRTQLGNDLAGVGHSIWEAGNGLEALKLLADNSHGIELIFCDVNMPEMDGLTMCREIHKAPLLSRIPIFMLTTQTSAEMKTEGKAAGVVAWIVKPYDKMKLLGGVAKILARQSAEA